MIFYFTGTGNSLFAAKRLLAEGERLVNIAEAIRQDAYTYNIPGGEAVGFVFPVYFYTVPDIIKEFIGKLSLEGASYVYAVITCGGGISQAGAVLKKILAERNIELSYVMPLLMPDNSMLFYQIPPVETAVGRLPAAEKELLRIKEMINKRSAETIGSSTILSDLVGAGFYLCNKTAKFYADDKCIHCGLCVGSCPLGIIELEEGKPRWTKSTCQKCSSCINRCPKGAIQYGKITQKRNRYLNPEEAEEL